MGLRNSGGPFEDSAAGTGRRPGARSGRISATAAGEGQTRAAIVGLLLKEGPITATAIGERLSLAPAGVRRHLEALIESGEARAARSAAWQQKGRGRPAKQYQLTAVGRGRLGHAYDDLAGAAMRQLREIGGDSAIVDFARKRVSAIVGGIERLSGNPGARDIGIAADSTTVADSTTTDPTVTGEAMTDQATTDKAAEIAEAFTDAGFAASTRKVGAGVQICQHHCPVSHVAEEFPELCAAELEAFRDLLGTHVQRLATIANGDCACTTHVPLLTLPEGSGTAGPDSAGTERVVLDPAVAQPATVSRHDSGRSSE